MYCLHFSTSYMIAYNSLTYVEAFCIHGDNFLLKKAIGRASCINIALIVIFKVFIFRMNSFEKSGYVKLGEKS